MQLPDLRQIRAFAAVADEGSFTLAARKLSLTQSAISHSLRTLEEQLDCRLLDRQGKRSSLTVEGEMFLRRCRRVMHELDLAAREIDGMKGWGQGRIRIGAPPTLCHYLLPRVLREMRDCFPGCEAVIEAGDTVVLLKMLGAFELDIVLGMKTKVERTLRYEPLFKDRLVFVVAPNHPWAQVGKVDGETLGREQFIVYARATETYRLVEKHLSGVAMRPPLVLADMEVIKEMAKVGVGIGVVAPWVARRELDEGSLVAIPISQPPLRREWGFYSLECKTRSLVEETFVGISGMLGEEFGC
jgi:DNA-binding transcriptional LysR family regulator